MRPTPHPARATRHLPLKGKALELLRIQKSIKLPFDTIDGILFLRGELTFSLPLEGKVSNVLVTDEV